MKRWSCLTNSRPIFGFPKHRSLLFNLRLFQSAAQTRVAIFWDLDNKPPNSFPPYDAAVRLKLAASSFGAVRYTVAYANPHAFRYVPPAVQEQRKERKALDHLEAKGLIKPSAEYLCRVCGRRFHTNLKLVNHFKCLHEREQAKRLRQLESARGSRRVQLVAKYAKKMEKYENAAHGVFTPKVGYGLADELKRAGFLVRTVADKPQAADIALRNHLVETMDRRQADCFVLVSDDSDFVDVLKEARLRCLRTVVVGDNVGGELRRCADAGFSWRDVLAGKARKEGVTVSGRWKDRDILKRLEWTYRPAAERSDSDSDDRVMGGKDDDDCGSSDFDEEESVAGEDCVRHWWELDSDDGSEESAKR
ncbi:hypothetical protein ACLOJK_005398 [Asimina triloba]